MIQPDLNGGSRAPGQLGQLTQGVFPSGGPENHLQSFLLPHVGYHVEASQAMSDNGDALPNPQSSPESDLDSTLLKALKSKEKACLDQSKPVENCDSARYDPRLNISNDLKATLRQGHAPEISKVSRLGRGDAFLYYRAAL